MSTPGHHVTSTDHPATPPGSFEYVTMHDRVVGMLYACPCGCGLRGALSLRCVDPVHHTWDQCRGEPTLAEDVVLYHQQREHWRGRLVGGLWITNRGGNDR